MPSSTATATSYSSSRRKITHNILKVVRAFLVLVSAVAHGLSTSSQSNKAAQTLSKNTNSSNLKYCRARYSSIIALTQQSINNRNKTKNHVPPTTFLENNVEQFKELTEQRDRSFARLLVGTTERRMGQIDMILNHLLDVYPPPSSNKHSALIQTCLRVGVVQLVFLQTSSHAAVSETVQVLKAFNYLLLKNSVPYAALATKKRVPDSMMKFTNAVLRKISRLDEKELTRLLEQQSDATTNIVPWLKDSLVKDWGVKKTKAVANAFMGSPHYLDLSVKQQFKDGFLACLNESNITYKVLAAAVQPHHQGSRISRSVRIKDYYGLVSSLPGYEEGHWWVQNVSASIPALALISALQKKSKTENFSNLKVVDLCSAPGGKTAQLLSTGLHVTAIEASANRAKRLRDNLKRLQFDGDVCDVIVTRGEDWIPENKVDAILLDAPCSATGVGIRRPDVLQKDFDSIEDLLETQKVLLEHCLDNVLKPGGILVYATCSILKAESEYQVLNLLKSKVGKKNNIKVVPFTSEEAVCFSDCIDESGFLRVLPGLADSSESDGFFVAIIEKLRNDLSENSDIVAKSNEDLTKLKVAELKERCRSAGLKTSGTKTELVNRLSSQ